MQLKETKLWPGADGSLVIPNEVMDLIGKGPDGSVYVTYLSEGEYKEQEVFISPVEPGCLTSEQLCEEALQLVVPEELLEEAGIQPDEDLDVVCEERRITIFPSKSEAVVPHEILELCGELGISPEKVRVIMEMEGLNGATKADVPSGGQ